MMLEELPQICRFMFYFLNFLTKKRLEFKALKLSLLGGPV
ncbi:hypothetical protein DYBT9275_01636 [Dyadobacter sp. CECT 9275]|uniref:Uncharacterized protein n=1 Tax=Dyadobacter helix TaxID=2822344 RepID=A0A916NB98_9BACT|nr:hypothetical protein DYBT9275_01636 [Dyadobacter sp. CECT 9275]